MQRKMRDYGKWSSPCRRCSGAAKKSHNLEGKSFSSQRRLKICPQSCSVVQQTFGCIRGFTQSVWEWLSAGLRDVRLLFSVCTWKMCGTGFQGDPRPTNPAQNGGRKTSPTCHTVAGWSSLFCLTSSRFLINSKLRQQPARPRTHTPTNPPTHTHIRTHPPHTQLLCTYLTETLFYKGLSWGKQAH